MADSDPHAGLKPGDFVEYFNSHGGNNDRNGAVGVVQYVESGTDKVRVAWVASPVAIQEKVKPFKWNLKKIGEVDRGVSS